MRIKTYDINGNPIYLHVSGISGSEAYAKNHEYDIFVEYENIKEFLDLLEKHEVI